jgi:hypothetical protein
MGQSASCQVINGRKKARLAIAALRRSRTGAPG